MRKIQVNVAGVSTSVAENLLTLKSNGDYEKHYNADMSLDTATIDAENLAKLIQDGEALVNGYVQSEVDKYNEANGTKFSDVHNASNYKDATGYTHQAFCTKVWDWNVAVWEKARTSQATAVVEGWAEEEFIAILPKFV